MLLFGPNPSEKSPYFKYFLIRRDRKNNFVELVCQVSKCSNILNMIFFSAENTIIFSIVTMNSSDINKRKKTNDIMIRFNEVN